MKIKTLGLFLAKQCNFSCIYCCADTGADPADTLSLAEIQDLIQQAQELGARSVCIAGEGEPLLDENLFPVCEYIRSLNMTPRVVTNMSCIDSATARRLRELGVVLICKLNSLRACVVDTMVGKQQCFSWQPYIYRGRTWSIPEPLKHLLEAGYQKSYQGIPPRKMLVLQTVATRYNKEDILPLARFARALAIGLDIENLLPPRNKEQQAALSLTRQEEAKLYREVGAVLGVRYRIWSKLRCVFEDDPFIDSRGNIRFCFGEEKSAGNIRTISLKELHRRQLAIKTNLSGESLLFDIRQKGFRSCRTRRMKDADRLRCAEQRAQ